MDFKEYFQNTGYIKNILEFQEFPRTVNGPVANFLEKKFNGQIRTIKKIF